MNMKSTNESRFLKTGNSMVGDEDSEDFPTLELTEEGKTGLRCDLAFHLTHEQVEEFDGIENAAIYFESHMEHDDSGLFVTLTNHQTRCGEKVNLYYCDGEVQEA